MITDLFYYGYYLPYKINNYSKTDKVTPVKKVSNVSKVAEAYDSYARKTENDTSSFFLNKAFKNKVLKYANSLSKGINGIKNISNYISNRLDNENATYDELSQNLSLALESFAGRYNDFEKLSEDNKEHALFIDDYAGGLKDLIKENSQTLERAGLTIDSAGSLVFNKGSYNNIPVSEIDDVASNLKNVFKDIYRKTFDIMSVPMSEHMNFKDLDYYYNYIYSATDPNTFRIIETGMLVDIAV